MNEAKLKAKEKRKEYVKEN